MTEKKKGGDGRQARGKEFFVEMAKNPRSRVILANTSDTYMMADITRQSDIIISRFRDELMRSVNVDEFTGFMDKYYDIIFSLEDHLKDIGEIVGIEYRKSRTYKSVKKNRDQDAQDSPLQAST